MKEEKELNQDTQIEDTLLQDDFTVPADQMFDDNPLGDKEGIVITGWTRTLNLRKEGKKSEYTGKQMTARMYILQQIRLDKRKKEIINGLVQNFDMTDRQANRYYLEAKEYLRREYQTYAKNICEKNTSTLLEMRDNAIDKGDSETALNCIKELNKMTGVYNDNKLTLETPSEVVIKLG